MNDQCPKCQIPMSREGPLRWCLYCSNAFDDKAIYTKTTLVRTSTGGERSLCVGTSMAKYIIPFFSGNLDEEFPQYKQIDCCLSLSKPMTKKSKVVVYVFCPK